MKEHQSDNLFELLSEILVNLLISRFRVCFFGWVGGWVDGVDQSSFFANELFECFK